MYPRNVDRGEKAATQESRGIRPVMDGGRWPNGEKVVTELEVGGWRLEAVGQALGSNNKVAS